MFWIMVLWDSLVLCKKNNIVIVIVVSILNILVVWFEIGIKLVKSIIINSNNVNWLSVNNFNILIFCYFFKNEKV